MTLYRYIILLLLVLLSACQKPDPIEAHYRGEGKYFGPERSTDAQGLVDEEPLIFRSEQLGLQIYVPVGVYDPTESEWEVLPFLSENTALVVGKDILEVGAGSGIISFYLAQQGAKSVLATDINQAAITAIKVNAPKHGFPQIRARLVPAEAKGAYDILRPDETFDLIISNPPWVMNTKKKTNSAVEETGELGFSLLAGLEQRLRPGGKMILFYNTYFAHKMMVKSAQARGFQVSHHYPRRIMPWEMEALCNNYSEHLDKQSGLPPGSLDLRWQKDLELANLKLQVPPAPPLIPGNSERQYPGMIVISRVSE